MRWIREACVVYGISIEQFIITHSFICFSSIRQSVVGRKWKERKQQLLRICILYILVRLCRMARSMLATKTTQFYGSTNLHFIYLHLSFTTRKILKYGIIWSGAYRTHCDLCDLKRMHTWWHAYMCIHIFCVFLLLFSLPRVLCWLSNCVHQSIYLYFCVILHLDCSKIIW